jgi:chorismate mutase
MMMMRGVRGATIANDNTEADILEATEELLLAMIEANGMQQDEVCSILFTTSPDLTACYPAKAARNIGWARTALLGFQEMAVPTGTPLCVRVLIHWNTAKGLNEIEHVYLRDAVQLRPDLARA